MVNVQEISVRNLSRLSFTPPHALWGATHLGSVRSWSLTCFTLKHWTTCCWLSVHVYSGCRAEVWLFMLIFFPLCHLLFFCDALQEIWNGIITPPVEVANRDSFLNLYFCTFISLFSRLSTDRVSSWKWKEFWNTSNMILPSLTHISTFQSRGV